MTIKMANVVSNGMSTLVLYKNFCIRKIQYASSLYLYDSVLIFFDSETTFYTTSNR